MFTNFTRWPAVCAATSLAGIFTLSGQVMTPLFKVALFLFAIGLPIQILAWGLLTFGREKYDTLPKLVGCILAITTILPVFTGITLMLFEKTPEAAAAFVASASVSIACGGWVYSFDFAHWYITRPQGTTDTTPSKPR